MGEMWFFRNGSRFSFTGDGGPYRSMHYDECPAFTKSQYLYMKERLMESKSRMYKVTYKLGFYKGERYVHSTDAEEAIAQVRLWCETRMTTLIAANVPESYTAEPPV